ncbi:NmrA-like family protein [Colletotrichum truncatum]|uniref:NmrA-like family protein n=1 Tax=Colletotrichum truncatum TaxID=5467 RepID=A0ACC3ZKM8_COLTU|nr:NmrA-like family protein [Colletotrichum truncatum]KAF6799842.1 NmrA-like family protein [Colletotrichum truncatum]
MSAFQNVALLGKGLLGSAILNELVNAGFTVTVFGRSESSKEGLPSGVKFTTVDYASIDSLTSALQGQDVVVSTVSKGGLFSQNLVIDASIKAGVKRYIPSDFGGFTTDPKAHRELANVLAPMISTQTYLAEKARSGEIEHTIFSIGAFLDLIVKFPMAFDYSNKSTRLVDGGRHPWSATSLASIGKAVAGSLKNPEATKNKNLHIHELVVTQAQLYALAKKYSPPGTEWKETYLDGEAEFSKAVQAAQEDLNEGTLLGTIVAALLSGRYAAEYKQVDNELVGVPLLTEEDLDARFAALYKS